MELTLPTNDELKKLDLLTPGFNSQIASAISIVYSLHGWHKEDLHKLVPGVGAEQWKRYGQQSYKKMRPAHIIAALSWASQVSMVAILRGRNVIEYWTGAPRNSIDVIARCGLMSSDTFDFFIKQIVSSNRFSCKDKDYINSILYEIEPPSSEDYLFPEFIDVDIFAEDYYRSSAKVIKNLRCANGFTMSEMAKALGVTVSTYRRLEDINRPKKYIDSLLAFRFKHAFKIEDTTGMLFYMEKYKGFYFARKIQESREKILKFLLVNSSNYNSKVMAERASLLLKHQKSNFEV